MMNAMVSKGFGPTITKHAMQDNSSDTHQAKRNFKVGYPLIVDQRQATLEADLKLALTDMLWGLQPHCKYLYEYLAFGVLL